MEEEKEKTTIEFGGMSFTGGKAMILVTALSTLGGASWGAFEIYKDYMDMKEIIQNIDTTEIENRNKQIAQKLQDAIEYTRDIKNGLREDITRIERQVDRADQRTKENEEKVRDMIDIANQRFENKRDQLAVDTDRKVKEVEDRLNSKLQRALDNPLAN